jgi:hypothetical protein
MYNDEMGIMKSKLIATAVLLGALAMAPNAQAQTNRYRYVADTTPTGNPDGYAFGVAREQSTPKGYVTATGRFQFLTPDGSFTFRLDDDKVADGRTVPVLISSSTLTLYECVPIGATVRYEGFDPGDVSVEIMGKFRSALGYGDSYGCTNGAVTGSAYIGGV